MPKIDYWRHDWRTAPGLRTTIISPVELFGVLGIKPDPNSFSFRRFVQSALNLNPDVDKGTVHTWTYSDGSIRATFQPS